MRLIDADALSKDICDYIERMTKIGVIVDGQSLWDKLNVALNNAPIVNNEWVPVSERMPDADVDVLVTVYFKGNEWHRKPFHYVDVANQYNGAWYRISGTYKIRIVGYEVIAWMPLPEPYQEKEYEWQNDE